MWSAGLVKPEPFEGVVWDGEEGMPEEFYDVVFHLGVVAGRMVPVVCGGVGEVEL